MFEGILKFGNRKELKKAIVFYVVYVILGIIVSGVVGFIYGFINAETIPLEEMEEYAVVLGAYSAIGYSILMSVILLLGRKFNIFIALLVLISTVGVGYLFGLFGSGVILAIASTQGKDHDSFLESEKEPFQSDILNDNWNQL